MQFLFTAETLSGAPVNLPFHYQSSLQGLIYALTEGAFGSFLHDVGYQNQKRAFRLFSFSQILQRPEIRRIEHRFVFPPQISWVVSTVENELADALMETMYISTQVQLAGNVLRITSLKLLPPKSGSPMEVRTLSPVCTYTTAVLADGRKRTIYYSPNEREFVPIIRKNLQSKYQSWCGQPAEKLPLDVTVLNKPRELVTSYKGFVVKGWMADFQLSGSEELIELALCAGMGSKNAQGFGLIVPKDQLNELI